jgi:hypothetical protein
MSSYGTLVDFGRIHDLAVVTLTLPRGDLNIFALLTPCQSSSESYRTVPLFSFISQSYPGFFRIQGAHER